MSTNRDGWVNLAIFVVMVLSAVVGGIVVYKKVKTAEKSVQAANLAVKM